MEVEGSRPVIQDALDEWNGPPARQKIREVAGTTTSTFGMQLNSSTNIMDTL